MTKLVLLLVSILVIYANARHIHHKENVEDKWENEVQEVEERAAIKKENTDVPVDIIRNIKPNRFVPINNAIFFMGYLPCQDGFKRDFMGVCREVWD
ncbi:hypothetical protein MSG28_003300 [Choristoneura fumiferana]|uniref:Uncharacterized protein n=1 Tax=Choristoneura fumiferana TaxID=7141 RepID=A0ACC0KE96_CHOFU|nr:hypothetical protein MSG28_003300 [Choristoneura fumiferana]